MDPNRTAPDELAQRLRRVQNDYEDAEQRLSELRPELLRISRRLGDLETKLRAHADALREALES